MQLEVALRDAEAEAKSEDGIEERIQARIDQMTE